MQETHRETNVMGFIEKVYMLLVQGRELQPKINRQQVHAKHDRQRTAQIQNRLEAPRNIRELTNGMPKSRL